VLVVQRVFRAKRTNLHEKYDYPVMQPALDKWIANPAAIQSAGNRLFCFSTPSKDELTTAP